MLTGRTGDFECPKQTADETLAMMLRIEQTNMLVELHFSMDRCRLVSVSSADLYGDESGMSSLASARTTTELEVLRNVPNVSTQPDSRMCAVPELP